MSKSSFVSFESSFAFVHSMENAAWMLIHSLWQLLLIAIIFAGIRIVLGACSRLSLQQQSKAVYWWGCVSLAFMIIVPIGTFCRLWVSGDTTPTVVLGETSLASPIPGLDTIPVSYSETALDSASIPSSSLSTLNYFHSWIVVGWAIGILLFAMRPLLGLWHVRRLYLAERIALPQSALDMARSTAVSLGVGQSIEFAGSMLVKVPTVIGHFHPVILLPGAAITGLTTSQLEQVLAHEIAHIRRNDFAINLVQTLIETTLFFHPAVWWLSHQVRVERENCCDDVAVSKFGSRHSFAEALMSLEQIRAVSPPALGATGGNLVRRIRRLLEPSTQSPKDTNGAILGGILATLLLATIVCFAAPADAANQDPPQKQSFLPTQNLPKPLEDLQPEISADANSSEKYSPNQHAEDRVGRSTVDIFSNAPGSVVEVLVKPDDLVKPGQVLLRLTNVELDHEIEAASASLSKLENQILDQASQDPLDKDPSRSQSFDNVLIPRSQILKKQLKLLKTKRSNLQVVAPCEGVVMTIHIGVQQPVQAGQMLARLTRTNQGAADSVMRSLQSKVFKTREKAGRMIAESDSNHSKLSEAQKLLNQSRNMVLNSELKESQVSALLRIIDRDLIILRKRINKVSKPGNSTENSDNPRETHLIMKHYGIADLVVPHPLVNNDSLLNFDGEKWQPRVGKQNFTSHPPKSKTSIDPQPLINLIQETIEPDSWEKDSLNQIQYFEPNLSIIVAARPKTHEQIQILLKKLRELYQVTLEVRSFLVIGDNDELAKIPHPKIGSEPTTLPPQAARYLRSYSLAKDAVACLDLPRVTRYNGQSIDFKIAGFKALPETLIKLTQTIGNRGKTVRSEIRISEKELTTANERKRADWTRAMVSAPNGQSVAVDISHLLPKGSTQRAIFVFQPFIFDERANRN